MVITNESIEFKKDTILVFLIYSISSITTFLPLGSNLSLEVKVRNKDIDPNIILKM